MDFQVVGLSPREIPATSLTVQSFTKNNSDMKTDVSISEHTPDLLMRVCRHVRRVEVAGGCASKEFLKRRMVVWGKVWPRCRALVALASELHISGDVREYLGHPARTHDEALAP